MNAAGPASAITAPEPTKRPAPMTPPIAIIVRWRCLSPFCRAGDSVVSLIGGPSCPSRRRTGVTEPLPSAPGSESEERREGEVARGALEDRGLAQHAVPA